MPKKERGFDSENKSTQILRLLVYLTHALSECGHKNSPKWKTDVWGIATQYGRSSRIKRTDFDLIKNMTIQEIADLITKK